jgi:hypothetical protein
MMKKLFTLIVMLAAAGIMNVQAQVLQQQKHIKLPVVNNSWRAAITPDANQGWWGFVGNDTEKQGLGVRSVDTYHCAIFIPGNHAVAGGKTIHAVRFGLVAPNAADAKVWIASSLPNSIDAANCIQVVDVPQADLGNLNIDVALSSPYAIPVEGVYVGYSFSITELVYTDDAYPVLTTGEDAPNTLILRTNENVPSWTDLNGNGFGALFLQVLLEGEFADNQVTPADFGPIYAKVGETVNAEVTLTNNGITPISSIDYTITTDGVTGAEQHVDIASPIAFASKGKAVIVIPAETTQSIKDKTLTITKVNDNPNEAANKTAQFTLYSLPKIIDRNVVVEEFTGTGCGWCPRGLVGMEKLRNNFGDRFIGIGIHRYNTSDPMYIANYAPISFSGAPSARIDRGQEIDPYYGIFDDICNDFSNEMAIPSLGAIEVSGTFDEEQDIVNATAVIEPLFDDTYDVEFSLVADGLTGTTNAWKQSNYYAQYSASQLPDDLSIFGNGGKYGQSSVAGWIFNDVAIASSFKSNTNQVTAQTVSGGQKANYAYTLPLPTDATLKDALKMDQIYVVAIMTNSKGMVVNAAKVKVTDYDPSSVSGIRNATTTEAARYTLDGRQVTAPQHGLNIIRLSDGSVKKIMVK